VVIGARTKASKSMKLKKTQSQSMEFQGSSESLDSMNPTSSKSKLTSRTSEFFKRVFTPPSKKTEDDKPPTYKKKKVLCGN
jgi:hypothetical protein